MTHDEREEQAENLERVSSRIALAIIRFCQGRKRFHMDELRAWVVSETGIAAPDSAGRILRYLRQRGVIDYWVVDRRASLYEVLSVNTSHGNQTTAA